MQKVVSDYSTRRSRRGLGRAPKQEGRDKSAEISQGGVQAADLRAGTGVATCLLRFFLTFQRVNCPSSAPCRLLHHSHDPIHHVQWWSLGITRKPTLTASNHRSRLIPSRTSFHPAISTTPSRHTPETIQRFTLIIATSQPGSKTSGNPSTFGRSSQLTEQALERK